MVLLKYFFMPPEGRHHSFQLSVSSFVTIHFNLLHEGPLLGNYCTHDLQTLQADRVPTGAFVHSYLF